MYGGKYKIDLQLPDHLQAMIPPGWHVELAHVDLQILRLKENGWFSIQATYPDGSGGQLATKIPLGDWQRQGRIKDCAWVLLANGNRGGAPIGIFDVPAGSYAYIQEDVWARDAFDTVNGGPRKLPGGCGCIGWITVLLGMRPNEANMVLSNSQSERMFIEGVMELCAKPGGHFEEIRKEYLMLKNLGRL
jgi:hypothetical protein